MPSSIALAMMAKAQVVVLVSDVDREMYLSAADEIVVYEGIVTARLGTGIAPYETLSRVEFEEDYCYRPQSEK